MRRWTGFLAAASLLLLVGAGCGSSGTKVDAGAKIDAAAGQIEKDATSEQTELKTEEQDAAQVDNDKADVNAYGEATYEIK